MKISYYGYKPEIQEILGQVEHEIKNGNIALIQEFLMPMINKREFDVLTPLYLAVFHEAIVDKNEKVLTLVKEMKNELFELTYCLFHSLIRQGVLTKDHNFS